MMVQRQLGSAGLSVSALGLGCQWLGDVAVSDAEAARVIEAAVDAGITLFDTARSYGLSEARLGKFLKPVRNRVLLSTKLGYDIDGVPDWTASCIRRGVDEALHRLQTDVIDIVHFHSCPLPVLQQGEVLGALAEAKRAGKLRVMAYSGENDALDFAIGCGQFDSVQCSLNLVDQRNGPCALPLAKAASLGVLIKRPLANTVWQYREQPQRADLQIYWQRWQLLASALTAIGREAGVDPAELALRFAAFSPAVSSVLVGTTRIESVQRNLAAMARGPLSATTVSQLQAAYLQHGSHWPGLI